MFVTGNLYYRSVTECLDRFRVSSWNSFSRSLHSLPPRPPLELSSAMLDPPNEPLYSIFRRKGSIIPLKGQYLINPEQLIPLVPRISREECDLFRSATSAASGTVLHIARYKNIPLIYIPAHPLLLWLLRPAMKYIF